MLPLTLRCRLQSLIRTNVGTQDHLLGLIIDGLARERARGGDRPLEPRNSRCEAPYRKGVVIRRKGTKALHVCYGVSIEEGEAGEVSLLSQDQQATLHRFGGSSRRSKTSCSMARDRIMSNTS